MELSCDLNSVFASQQILRALAWFSRDIGETEMRADPEPAVARGGVSHDLVGSINRLIVQQKRLAIDNAKQ